ncbi:WYL domain-containing protein [Deinococcus taklimakanensis]|uniref:WYL domain-containing protein n=1 Tax=Deinococcus taklimakanensis TaxID=536443 RepID=A0ABW5NZX6_9DEIO
MQNTIIEAIKEKRVLTVRYSAGERAVEPHTLGIGTTGNLLIRAHQRDGASTSGTREGWKLFKVDELHAVEITDEEFSTRDGYKRGDKAMQSIIEEV